MVVLLLLARSWEYNNVHTGQQGSVLGLPMDHRKIDALKKLLYDFKHMKWIYQVFSKFQVYTTFQRDLYIVYQKC